MIVTSPNPILTTPTKEFDFNDPPEDPNDVANQLMQTMHEKFFVGLSANQIGKPYKVFALRGTDNYFVCFNPKIVYYSESTETEDEQCVSFPGIKVKVKRSNEIRLRFQTPSGRTESKTFNGLSARVIQHEIDHLNGIPFYNKANRYHRERALKNVGKR